MEKKIAIFDMDGTLVDSMGYWLNVVSEYIEEKKHNIKVEKDKIFKDDVVTMTDVELAKYLKNNFGYNISEDELVRGFESIMERHYKYDVKLKSNVQDYLEKLKNENVKMCVASSTPEHLIELCLEKLNIRRYFDFVLSCATIGTGKNEPKIYNEAKNIFKADAKDIAVYEDSIVALKTAKGAGFYTIGVYDKYSKNKWDEIKTTAEEVIDYFN